MPRVSAHRDDRLRREYQRRRRELTPPVDRQLGHVYAQLRGAIRTGEVRPNEQLVEHRLMSSLLVPRSSVRRALQMLAADGLVERERRAGTSVTGSIVVFGASRVLPTERVDGPMACAVDPSQLTVTEADCTVLPTPPFLADRLQTSAPEIVAVREVAFLDGRPLYVRSGYAVHHDDYREDIRRANQVKQTLEEVFEKLFGQPYGGGEIDIYATGADVQTAELLDVEEGSPVLVREMLVCDVDATPRELSFTYFRGDRASVVSSRPG